MTQKLPLDSPDQSLSALMRVMAAANVALGTRECAQAALEQALMAAAMSSGSVWLHDHDEPICLARYPDPPAAQLPQPEAAIERVLSTGRPEFSLAQGQPANQVAAILPLVARGEQIGAIALAGAHAAPSRLLLSAIAEAIAGALQQARMAEQIEAQGRDLQSIKRQQDQLISIIAHDLKNPMASIKGYADLLLRRSARNAEDPNRRGLQVISEQIVRMTALLDTLLDISRIASERLLVERRPADLAGITTPVVEDLREATGRQDLTLEAAEGAYAGLFDARRIRQAIENVLGNALAYSPVGGPITVRMRRDRDEAIIEIHDRGIGIPAAERERLFEPFFRASNAAARAGMGMGLFVAQQILARHDGRIWFDSAEGQGSTFSIALPINT
jgi:signal transduction histidine kinase